MKKLILLILLLLVGCTSMSRPAPMEKVIPPPITVRGNSDELKEIQ